RRALPLGLVLGLQVLAGYPQFHVQTLLCLPLFVFAVVERRDVARMLFWLSAAELLALCLAAIELAPAMAAVGDSIRGRNVTPALYELFPVRPATYRAGLARPALDTMAPLYAGALIPLLAV